MFIIYANFCYISIFFKANKSEDLICKNFDRNLRIDGIIRFKNSSHLIFQSKHFWHLNPKNEFCNKHNITDFFHDNSFDNGIDAISYDSRSETIFIFKVLLIFS